jgi:pantetheine-phosphate adenylyltransferase
LADLARETGITTVIRGVRGAADLENEMTMARINRRLNPALETVLLPADAAYQDISASMVRQLASFGADLTPFVPPETLPDILAAFDTES